MPSDIGTQFIKKSVSLHGHKTSISLEKAFWIILKTVADSEQISLTKLIQRIDENRPGNLASTLRLYALQKTLSEPSLFKSSFEHPTRSGERKDRD